MKRLALITLFVARFAFAEGMSTTFVWAPTRPLDSVSARPTTFGEQQCYAWVPQLGITNGTTMTWYLTVGAGVGKVCTVTLYSGDGNTQIVTSGPQNCAGPGFVMVTGLGPFSFPSGQKLQLCTCGTAPYNMAAGTTGPFNDFRGLRNGLSAPLRTASAHDCTAGVAPATTGVFSASLGPQFDVLFSTNTP